MSLWQLPPTWMWSPLEEFADTTSGGTPRRDRSENYGGSIPWLKSGELNDSIVSSVEESITEVGLNSSSAKLLPKGTLCVAMYGATVGKLGILGLDTSTNQAICGIFLPQQIETLYLFRYLQFRRDELVAIGQGGAQPNISQAIIRRLDIPIAPHAEQVRIIEVIERCLSQLDNSVELLRRTQANLKRYRASVLKAACEGRLVPTEAELARKEGRTYETGEQLLTRILKERRAKWEADQLAKMLAAGKPPKNDDWKKKYKEPERPDTAGLHELPEGWTWGSVEQIGHVQLGRQRSPKNRSRDYPTQYVRAANITELGLDLTDLLEMEFTPPEKERYELHDGDILISEASGSPTQVGKPAIWRDQIAGCCFQNTVIRVRPWSIESDYLCLVFRSYYDTGYFARIAAGVGINHLGAEKFSRIPVPIPAIPEQKRISQQIESVLSLHLDISRQVESAFSRSARLRQSILKLTFEGKLVLQDPNDEPASVLLERIRGDRNASANAKIGTKVREVKKQVAEAGE